MSKLSLPSLALVATALVLSGGTARAQLSGTLTIDAASPTGGGVYSTFAECISDLVNQGVNGPVQVVVLPSLTPYAGFSVPVIPGTSAVNTVHFLGGGPPRPVISGAAPGFAQAVRVGTGTSTSAIGVGPSHLIFEDLEMTGAASGCAFLAIGSTFITVKNCLAHTSGSGIGFTASTDCVVEDCEVHGVGNTPGSGGSTLYTGGIWAYSNSARNLFQRNRVHDCAANGIFVGASGAGTATPDHVVINNMIWNVGTQTSSSYAGGLCMRRATNSIVANNSVRMAAASSYPALHVMGGASAAPLLPSVFSNNVGQHPGTGACIRTEYLGQSAPSHDTNLYDNVGAGPIGLIGSGTDAGSGTSYASLALWQVDVPGDATSLEGPAGYVSSTDLHITAGSLPFEAGTPVAQVVDDIDGLARPQGATHDIGAHEAPAIGLFASFSASITGGPANLSVSFTDHTFTSDPNGVQTWAWDFQNDGINDAFTQNPSFVYTCPGTYSVKLTVTDTQFPSSVKIVNDLITVTPHVYTISSTGGGVGDLTITPVPTTCGPALGATSGWTLISITTPTPVGGGIFAGITPDAVTWQFLFLPQAPGNPLSFIVFPPLYPDGGPLHFPSPALAALTGISMDSVMIFLGPGGTLHYVTNVSRTTF